jgi:peptidoglycan hydrolase-like protein with peptidoglycan-binding domain
MRHVVGLCAAFAVVFAGLAARAQSEPEVWIQIEATPSLVTAQERARAYANEFVDVNGFALASGWYAIALGPQPETQARDRLASLRFERLIPSDAYLVDGQLYVSRFWPVGNADMPQTQPEPASPEPTPEPEVATAPETAPEATPEIVPEPEPVETLAESRRAEQRLTAQERRDIQSALQWFGFYSAGIDGAFGPGTRGAISAWQTDQAEDPTGVLRTDQRARLIDGWQAALARIGLAPHVDEEAGISIDLPLGLVRFDSYAPPFAQFLPQDGSEVQVLLISQPGDQSALAGLYEILQSAAIMPMDGPRGIRGRSFEIRGRNTQIETYAYAEQSGDHVKGFVATWPQARGSEMVPVLAAMKSSFRSTGAQVLDPGMVPIDDGKRETLLGGLAPRKPVMSRTGFFFDASGLVVTVTEVVDGCDRVSIDGGLDMDVVFSDSALGLAALRPRVALAPMGHAKFAAALPGARAEVAVAGFSFESALSRPVMTFGSFESATGLSGETSVARLALAPLPGDAGGPVIDRNGAVLGMLVPRSAPGARQLPEDVSFLLPASEIVARLDTAGLASAPAEPALLPLAPEDMTRLGSEMAVMVSCWK